MLAARPRPVPGDAQHAVTLSETMPLCPACGTAMVRRTRRADGAAFWGCPAFPACRGTRPLVDAASPPAATATPAADAPVAFPPVQDSAGASADAEFARRRERHVARVRADRPEILVQAALMALAGILVAVYAPPSWLFVGIGLVGVAVLQAIVRLWVLPDHVTSWETGGEGERATARLLEVLEPEGYRVLHDRRIPRSRANIDHVVVGPTGVWVVETKSYRGSVRVERGEVVVGGRRKPGFVAEVRREQAAVSAALGKRPVAPVIVVHRADFPLFGSLTAGGVPVLPPERLVEHLRRAPAAMSPPDVAEALARLDRALPPAAR
jgi:hypothetical protein